jgi:hypothetical protein
MNCHCQWVHKASARGEVFKQVTRTLPGMDARIWDAVKFTCTIGVGRARTTEVCRAVQDYLGEEVQPARIRLVLEAHGIVKKSSLKFGQQNTSGFLGLALKAAEVHQVCVEDVGITLLPQERAACDALAEAAALASAEAPPPALRTLYGLRGQEWCLNFQGTSWRLMTLQGAPLAFARELALAHAAANVALPRALALRTWRHPSGAIWELVLEASAPLVRVHALPCGAHHRLARPLGVLLPLARGGAALLCAEQASEAAPAGGAAAASASRVSTADPALLPLALRALHALCAPCTCLAGAAPLLAAGESQHCACATGLRSALARHAAARGPCPFTGALDNQHYGDRMPLAWARWAAQWHAMAAQG